jgi:hypothetical protein
MKTLNEGAQYKALSLHQSDCHTRPHTTGKKAVPTQPANKAQSGDDTPKNKAKRKDKAKAKN